MSNLAKKPDFTGEKGVLSFVEELKRQWVATIDALVDPLMIVNQDFRIQKANRAMATLGATDVKRIKGSLCYEVFAQRQSPCPGCKLMETTTTGEPQSFDLEEIRGQRFYEVTSQPIQGENEAVEGIVHVYRDRTNARKLQEQVRQNEKLASIGMLAGGIAHEINNPLGGILIFSQMLLRELDQDSPHYQDVVEIEAATQRCKEIVESLLDFARAQNAQGRKRDIETFDVNEALHTALRFAAVNPNSIEVEISTHLEFDEPMIEGTRNKLIQIFLNLLQNAMQAMPDGGELKLTNRKEVDATGRSWVAYEIKDSGVGIAPENVNRIFDPFFTTKDPGEGTGLGLAICYGIVEEHGGTIHLESKVNRGTTFTLRFPLIRKGEAGHP